MYKNILVAVDLGHAEGASAQIDKASALLDAQGIIRLLHVLEEVPSYIAAELPRDLSERRKADARVELGLLAGKRPQAQVEVRSGSAATEILQCAEDTGADLIMIASHRPGLSDYFIGSTAARVVRHAQCSVLITR